MRSTWALGRVLLAASILLYGASASGQDITAFTGRVVAVPDGDSITVADAAGKERKIRLAGVDAPEPNQEYGPDAKNFLSGLVLDQTVTVVGRRFDTDGRLVAQVFLLGRDVSYSMIWAGLAWHDKEAELDQPKDDRKRYSEGEKFARNTKANIWSKPKPVAPWEFRKENPVPKQPEATLVLTPLNQPTSRPAATVTLGPAIEIVGNRNSKIYHWNPGCPDFSKISEKNRVPFKSQAEAEAAGFRPAKNCKTASP